MENLSTQLKELKAAKVALAELKAQHAEVTGQVQALTEALESESSRRVTTEQQAAEFAARRAELEQELARQTQVQEQLRAQLAEQQQRQDAQEQTHAVELGKLAESTKELEAARTNVAELQQQIASVNTQVQSLSESLTAESERRTSAERQAVELTARRTELELELAQRTQSQEQLRAQLAEQQQRLDAQVQTHNSEVGNLSARLKEFEAAQAALAALKLQHADATGQVQALTEALTAECGRRESVEKHAAELMARRTELEQEVARRSHTHEQLRAELADQERRLKAQAEVHHVELGNLATRTKELEAAQAALAELQQQIASVNTQVKSLTESLTAESGRRASLEQQAVELTARRTELEAEVGRRSQAQQELSAQLAEQELRMQMIAGELEDFRRRAGADALRQQQMAGEITESEQARAELGNELAAIRELNVSREASIQTLEAELQQRRSEQQRLDTLLQTEISQRRRLDEQLESIQLKLTETSGLLAQKCTAEQALLGRESELQRRLRNQQEEMATTSANLERQEAEIKNSRAKIAEFQSLQSALCGKIQDLTGQVQKLTESLSVESGQRIKADQRVAEMVLRHGELDQELTRRTQAQEQLRAELAEKQSRLNAEVQAHQTGLNHLATRITELEAAQTDLAELKLQHAAVTEQVQTLTGSLASETGRREIFERQVAELLARRTELEQELTQRTRAQDALRVQLEERVQAHNAELGKLVARTQELEIARTALVELNAQHAAVTAEVRQLTESLATECGRRESAEKAWRAREAELQGLLETQEEKLAKSGASLALQELEVKSARKTIEEMQVLQSSLCQKIQELTGQGEANAKLVQELKAKVIRFENAAVEGQKSLAVLRYAILDASRMNARLQRDRLLKERQNVEAMRRLLSSLVQTPLSLAQRGMLAEIQDSLDGLKQSRSGLAGSAFYPVEPPSFREGEFTFSEVTESAFRTVRAAAEAAGVAVQVSASGSTAGSLLGSAENVHQLITLLAVSPLTIETGITALDLRLAIKPKSDRFAEMTLRVALSSANAAHALLSRLNSVTAAAATLQTGSLNEAETGLAAGWQLAQAMGAQAILEVEGGVETCLVLSLPVEMAPQSAPASLGVTYVPALNGNRNGNGDHKSNGNGNGKHNGHHNGNGYHLTESRTGIEG